MSEPTTTLPAEAPDWMEFPEDRIETPYGEMRVIFNGQLMFDTSLKRNGSNEEHGGLVINQVRYYGSIHLTEVNGSRGYMPDPQGRLMRYHAVYLKRANWTNYNNSDPSEAAGKKIDKLVQDVLIPYAKAHEEQIKAGRRAAASHDLSSVYREIKEVRAKLAALEAKATDLWQQYSGSAPETRTRDIEAIAQWVVANVSVVHTIRQARAFAALVVDARGYDRTQPIKDNRFQNVQFDVPAPVTLP